VGEEKQRVAVLTLGCKVNHYDSALLRQRLVDSGFIIADKKDKADAYIINACTVTARSDFQARQLARRCKRKSPDSPVLVVGCYAQAYPRSCGSEKAVDAVVGNHDRSSIPGIVAHLLNTDMKDNKDLFAGGKGPAKPDFGDTLPEFERKRPYLKVQDGCDSSCAYCAVPRARGRAASLPPDEVLKRVEQLVQKGYREIVLAGVHLGSYGRDLYPPASLAVLIDRLESQGACKRLRLSSLEPQEIDDELLSVLAGSKSVCHHLHLPLQSGDDKVLREARRPYTSSDFSRIVRQVVRFWPDVAIGLDLIAGLPMESDDAYKRTFELVESLPVAYLHVFPFSPRPGTGAFDIRDRPPQRIGTERARQLRELGSRKKRNFLLEAMKRSPVYEVLVESVDQAGHCRGRSRNYISFSFPGNSSIIGTVVPVCAEALEDNGLLGRPLDSCYSKGTGQNSNDWKKD